MFNYEINIAIYSELMKMDIHFARVELNSLNNESFARFDFETFCQKFPASEGFSLTLSRVPVKTSETIAYSEGA